MKKEKHICEAWGLLLVLLVAVVGIFDPAKGLYASTDVNVVLSTPTYSGVNVSSGSRNRVDNRIHGSTYAVSSTRIGIQVQNLDPTNAVFCSYDQAFSTFNSVDVGHKINAGDVYYVGMLRAVTYYCQAADAAGASGVWVNVETANKE